MSQAPNDLTFTIKATPDDESIRGAARHAREEFEHEMGGVHGQLEKLNDVFGRSSTFGHLLHAAEGGGALFGIGMLGRDLAEGTEKLKELTEKLHEGKITGGQMVDEIAKGLPLLGSFYSATRNIVDLMTGEAELQKQIADSAKDAAEFRKTEFEAAKKMHDLHEQFTRSINAANNAAANTYLEGPGKSIAQLQQQMAERVRTHALGEKEAQDKASADIDKDMARRADEIAQARTHLNAANKAVRDAEDATKAAYGVSYNPNDPTQQVDAATRERAENAKRHLEELTARNEAEAKRRDAAREQAKTDFNNLNLAENRRDEEAITKLREDQQKQRADVLAAGEKRIADAQAKAREAGLTAERQAYQAHLVELQHALSNTLTEIGKRTGEQIQKDVRDTTFGLTGRFGHAGQDIFQALREAAAEYQNFSAQSGAAKKEFDESERTKALQRESELSKVNLDLLRAQAEVGDRAAKLEIQKLETAEKYRDLQRELMAIMTNPAMSADAKDQAAHQLAQLPYLQMLAQASIHDTRQLPANLAGLQTVSSRGAAAAAGMIGHAHEAAQLSGQHDPQQEVAEQLKQLIKLLEKTFGGTPVTDLLTQFMNAAQLFGLGAGSDSNGNGNFDH